MEKGRTNQEATQLRLRQSNQGDVRPRPEGASAGVEIDLTATALPAVNIVRSAASSPFVGFPPKAWTVASAVVFPVHDLQSAKGVEKMLAAQTQTERAINFLRDRLSAHPQVREAFAVPISNGFELQAFVEEPYLQNTDLVLDQVDAAMDRFPEITIRFCVVPITSDWHRPLRDDLISIVHRGART